MAAVTQYVHSGGGACAPRGLRGGAEACARACAPRDAAPARCAGAMVFCEELRDTHAVDGVDAFQFALGVIQVLVLVALGLWELHVRRGVRSGRRSGANVRPGL